MARLGDVSIRMDTTELRRTLRQMRRERTGQTQAARGSKLLTGTEFVQALTDSGLLPPATTYVQITAEVGGVVSLDYETYAESEILAVAKALKETDSLKEATVR